MTIKEKWEALEKQADATESALDVAEGIHDMLTFLTDDLSVEFTIAVTDIAEASKLPRDMVLAISTGWRPTYPNDGSYPKPTRQSSSLPN